MVFKPSTYSTSTRKRSRRHHAIGRLVSLVLVVLLTSLAGYLCGNGIHALCPPHPPPPPPVDVELRRPESSAGLAMGTGCGEDERLVRLDGGGMVTGSRYFVRLCRRNTSQAGAFYDEFRLEREEEERGVLVTKWSASEWRQMVQRLSNCYPLHNPARCLAPQGPHPQFCPRATLLKKGLLLLCYDSRFRIASMRFGNVQLSRIESIVFVETCLFWVP